MADMTRKRCGSGVAVRRRINTKPARRVSSLLLHFHILESTVMGSSQSRAESSVDRIKRYSSKSPLKAAFGRSAETQNGKSQEAQVCGGCAALSILSRLICGHLCSSSCHPNRHHHHQPTRPRPSRRNCCPRCPPLFPARCVVRMYDWIRLNGYVKVV